AEGATLLVISPIPDAALDGSATLDGYRRDLKRTMVRLYRFNGRAVDSITMSLEQSNKPALRFMALQLGLDLPADMQSEQVLKNRLLTSTTKADFADLPNKIRQFYDQDLKRQTGKRFRAGSELLN